MSSGCLSSGEDASHSECSDDGLSLLSGFEVDCPYSPLGDLWEDGRDAGIDGGFHLHSLQDEFLEHVGRAWLVLGAVLMEGGLLLIEVHEDMHFC